MEAIGPPNEKTAAVEISKKALLDLESNERFEYDPWLLDDHPLRSYPTECIPGLSTYLNESIGSWKAICLRAGCLILACLAAFQCLRLLPSKIKPTLGPHKLRPIIQTHSQSNACTFPMLDTGPHALKSSLIKGCKGLRTAVWMHNGELQTGNAVAGPEPEAFLQRLGLDHFLAKLDAEDDSTDQASFYIEKPSKFHADLAESFLLILEVKTSLHELYPHLVEHLDPLRQRGYLSHWNGRDVVQRPMTIVVTGEALPESDCINHSYSDVFWSALPEGRVPVSEFTKDGLRHLTPVCIV